MKRWIAVILTVVFLLSIVLIGISYKTPVQAKSNVILTVLTHRTDLVDTDFKKFAADYKKKTGVTIKWEGITDYEGDVKVRLSSGNYGDVLDIPTTVALSDLPQFFEPLGKNTDKNLKDYWYITVKGIKDKKTGTYTVYGIPTAVGIDGIVYNKAVFRKAGYNQFPKTLKDWYAASAKIAKMGVVPLGINFANKWPLSCWDSMAMVIHKKGDYWINIYKDPAPFSLNKPHGKSFDILYNFVHNKWVEKDITTTNWEQSKSDLGEGRIAAMILGSWAIPQMQQFAKNKNDIGFAAIPVDNSGKLYAVVGADYCLGVSKKSKYKKEAKDFVFAFVNSNYADSQGFLNPKKGKEPTNPVLKEFLKSGVTLIEYQDGPNGDELEKRDKIAQEARIDFWGGTYIQDVVLAAQKGRAAFEKKLAELNQRWAAAKKKLGY
jgi:ABC-type glycerol-3-phosphate transport system substrate-binding protein